MLRREQIFLENPSDIETIFAAIKIAELQEKQLLFLDQLIGHMRLDGLCDITEVCYKILNKMKLIECKTFEKDDII